MISLILFEQKKKKEKKEREDRSTSRRPLPVEISMVMAVAKLTMARRPSHTMAPWLSFALCSHLTVKDIVRGPTFLLCALILYAVNISLFVN